MPFNPERFKHEVQSPLTLEDVEALVLGFVRRQGRKVAESDAGLFEFLLPDCLKGVEGLERRYAKVTFDRAAAIRDSELEFMAIGHPFTNAVLKHCGSVGFGGLASSKVIKHTPVMSGNGVFFNFTIKITKAAPGGESVFFEFVPVFVRDDETVGLDAVLTIVSAPIEADMSPRRTESLASVERLFEKAKAEALVQYSQYQPWDEDVFCLNALRIEIV